MTWPDGFQVLCVVVLAAAYLLYLRQVPRASRRQVVIEMLLVALGAWASEETSIVRYAVYGYPDWWWLKLDEVPIMIVAIWPMVVMSARAVVTELFPARRGLVRALLVAAVVMIDASLVEVLAVRAGLWGWTLPGYLGVPVIGMLGWAFYAGAITWALERWDAGRALWLTPIVALGATHALLVAAWWGLFKWASVPLPPAAIYLVMLFAIATSMLLLKYPTRRIGWPIALPRMLAAGVFVILLFELQLRADVVFAFHWLHLAAVAMVYTTAVRWPLATAGHGSARDTAQ